MPGIFPEGINGGQVIRDGTGTCVNPPNVLNAYCPPLPFTFTCLPTALASDCVSKIMPAQMNAVVSEMLCLAATLNPDGEWDCDSTCNLSGTFSQWIAENLVMDGVTIQGAGTLLDPWHVNIAGITSDVVVDICNNYDDVLSACLISADANNRIAPGTDGLLNVQTVIDGSTIIGAGVLGDAWRVNPAEVPLLSAANVFTEQQIIRSTNPLLRLHDTNAPLTHNIVDLRYENGQYLEQIRDDVGNFVATACNWSADATGVISHNWRIGAGIAMSLTGAGFTVNNSMSVTGPVSYGAVGDTLNLYYDDSNGVYRSFGWDDTIGGFVYEDSSGALNPLVSSSAVAVLQYQQPSATPGGTATSGSWQPYPMNTEVADPNGIVSLSLGEFTITVPCACDFCAVFHQINGASLRIYNVTDSVPVGYATNARSGVTGTPSMSTSYGTVLLAAGKTYRVEYYVVTTKTTDGLGATTSNGVVEVYGQVTLRAM